MLGTRKKHQKSSKIMKKHEKTLKTSKFRTLIFYSLPQNDKSATAGRDSFDKGRKPRFCEKCPKNDEF